jgi:hypothetical protein
MSIGQQRNKSRTFTQQIELVVVVVVVPDSFALLTFPALFSSPFLPHSLSLLSLYYNPLFSLPTILSAPSHPLSSPVFTSPSYPSPNCHHITS